jgi:flavin-dependent dehydrogenase
VIYDVAVIGCGPAGSAVAASLAQRGRSVVVFERSNFETPRIGETFGGELQSLLRAIGAWDSFIAMPPVPFRSVLSAWGSPELTERSSITHPFGDGFHVDRARFDELLARAAQASGASVRTRTGRCKIERVEHGLRVQPARGRAAVARFLVDASGRGAPASAALARGRRWLAWDRMVALVGRFSGPLTSDQDLLIEACEEGWWYSAPQPDGTLVVALMTDADLSPAGPREGLNISWLTALKRAPHTAARTYDTMLNDAVRVVRADTGCLLPERSSGICAIGDAAMALDPLAGNGVARALRSGLEAAEAIDQILSGGGSPESPMRDNFTAALERRARYYSLENRWPAAPFWSRRRPPNWAMAPVTLAPTSLLHWDGRPLEREPQAKVEALLPRRAIAGALELMRAPQPAHNVLRTLREQVPMADRYLLVGLQVLVEHAHVECIPDRGTPLSQQQGSKV